MSAPDTGYHAPIDIDAPVSLAEHRARRQRPGHWADVPSAEEIDAAEERDAIVRAGRAVLPAAVIAVALAVALVVVLVRLSLKG